MFMQIDCMFFKTVKKNNTNNTTYKKTKTDLDSILCSAITKIPKYFCFKCKTHQ